MKWTDLMVQALKQRWADGATATEIAKELGVTRNAVIGRVHRLGLSVRRSPIETKEEKFERMVDMIGDFDAPIAKAAEQVNMGLPIAMRMWREMCARMGRQAA
jgi:GcrA cell cycle regulator